MSFMINWVRCLGASRIFVRFFAVHTKNTVCRNLDGDEGWKIMKDDVQMPPPTEQFLFALARLCGKLKP
jgi:hypothetical protein